MTDKSKDKSISEVRLSFSNKKNRDNELCDVTLASVNGQKLKAHRVILSALDIFFKKLLVNDLNHHP